jgi:hypothetical protein
MKRKSQCSPKSSLVSSKKISSRAGSRRSKTTRATKPRKAPEAPGWEAVQTMNSARQVYTWLQSIWIQGRPVIHPLTEYREVKNVCLLIGLQFPLRNKDRH